MTSTVESIPVNHDCDECGKKVEKIWRVLKGHRFCSTCYARVFKRRICPKCGNYARLPKNNPDAICRKCESNAPCVRCGVSGNKIGKITPYGPVCKNCVYYFSEPKLCGSCGRLAANLTRVTRLGIEIPVCPRCTRSDHANCQACGRHRLLFLADNGTLQCKKCIELGNISCPNCGQSMPAGYGKQCPDCYWQGLLNKRITINCAAFSVKSISEDFKDFGEWLGNNIGSKSAAYKINKYLPFFIEIESMWKTIPTYQALLNHFGTLKLRRVLLIMKWLDERKGIKPDEAAKLENSDQKRIDGFIGKFNHHPDSKTLIGDYYQHMLVNLKSRKTTIRSIRLALSPAAALLDLALQLKQAKPDQDTLNKYLSQKPGQRAALSGFVCYLRNFHSLDIELPKVNATRSKLLKRRKLESEILKLMQETKQDEESIERWLSVALAYFHGLPKSAGKKIYGSEGVKAENNGYSITWNNQIYWVPKINGYNNQQDNLFS